MALTMGCSGSKKIDVGTPCVLNSDCNNPLSCTFGKCHEGCRSTVDCQPGQECTKISGLGVCLLPAETTCAAVNSSCMASLVCASDLHCRSTCPNGVADCMGSQACVSGVCADLTDLVDGGQLPQKYTGIDGGVTIDGAADAPTSGAGGTSGASVNP